VCVIVCAGVCVCVSMCVYVYLFAVWLYMHIFNSMGMEVGMEMRFCRRKRRQSVQRTHTACFVAMTPFNPAARSVNVRLEV